MNKLILSIAPAIAISMLAGSASAETLAFVKASSELDGGRPRSYAFNLVDGKPNTVWCAKPDDTELKVVVGFKKPVKINKIGVVAGSIKGGEFDKKRRSAAILAISDGALVRETKLARTVEEQFIRLKPAAKGTQISITVKEARGDDGPVCIGELSFHTKRGQLSGNSIGTKVRGLSSPARRLVHNWVDNIDAPERTLLLALDGTFTYRYVPLLEGDPVTLRGTWRGGRKTLRLEVGSKTYAIKSRLSRVDDGDGQADQLNLRSGKAPHPSLIAEYHRAPSPGL